MNVHPQLCSLCVQLVVKHGMKVSFCAGMDMVLLCVVAVRVACLCAEQMAYTCVTVLSF